MSEFTPLILNPKNIKDGVLTISNTDLFYNVFDENIIPENVNKIILKSNKNIDFAVILRSKEQLLTYEIGSYTKGKILFILEQEDVKAKREIHLLEDADVTLVIPDFRPGNRDVNIKTKLLGFASRADWRLSSYSLANDKKKFVISFAHYGTKSFADMHNYGVVLDQSNLIFTGDSTVYENVKDAETHQTARIIVFDSGSYAQADPVLNIYHNDIIAASHAATVGQVNSEHLYYLNTRGLSDLDAKRLITKGYLMPILEYIDDEKMKEHLTGLLEGVL